MGCAASNLDATVSRTVDVKSPGLDKLLKTLKCDVHANTGAGTKSGLASSSCLTIFDWDDTLFPTHWWDRTGLAILDEDDKKTGDVARSLLVDLSKVLLTVLAVALAQSDAKIFTNRPRSFVKSSTLLAEELSDVEVTYARELLKENEKSASVKLQRMQAKMRAMERAMRERRQAAGRGWSSILCIGSASDHHAAIQKYMQRLANRGADNCIMKSIRLITNPSLTELLGQMRLLSLWLPKIIALEEPLFLRFGGDFEHLLAAHERFQPDAASPPLLLDRAAF